MKNIKIELLRPTQVTHGLREIRQKTEAYLKLRGHDLQMAIAEKPVPIVMGSGDVPYAIDHHHVATALWLAKVKSVPVVLVKDLSALSTADFWLTLENKRWTHPYNAHGQRVLFSDMSKHIWDLEDDEFRSLSASVRDAGGYEKTSVPLEEFRWADFFRQALPPRERRGVRIARRKGTENGEEQTCDGTSRLSRADRLNGGPHPEERFRLCVQPTAHRDIHTPRNAIRVNDTSLMTVANHSSGFNKSPRTMSSPSLTAASFAASFDA
ncbi:chromosome partitioning protein ParB [Caballeronia calidae]|uniref:Chromosome partitioning protein ParB n=1 Tax=Caballeronia calidae TaxID=1777139 RepID=A0A158DB47_9BURK|nr:chromosome partitioning protein ParB [Caballeronia calidae]